MNYEVPKVSINFICLSFTFLFGCSIDDSAGMKASEGMNKWIGKAEIIEVGWRRPRVDAFLRTGGHRAFPTSPTVDYFMRFSDYVVKIEIEYRFSDLGNVWEVSKKPDVTVTYGPQTPGTRSSAGAAILTEKSKHRDPPISVK